MIGVWSYSVTLFYLFESVWYLFMHQTLYRKYRPKTFDDVYGQDHITSVLKYESANDRINHAYLFCGSRGTGKTSCAKILAKSINCERPQNGNPCCECYACKSIDSGAATDVIEMDAASNNGVDYIRAIRDEVVYTPALLKKKVYIIDEVHMLSSSAFNALLKTLEEPPEHVVFILATTEFHKLPATIVSRCQRFDFHRIQLKDITNRLLFIASQENIRLEQKAAESIAKLAQGGMRDAISMMELCSSHGDITEASVGEVLGVSGYAAIAGVVRDIHEKNLNDLFHVISTLTETSKDIAVFWQELLSFYRDMMIYHCSDNPAGYLDLTETESGLLAGTASLFSLQEIQSQGLIVEAAYQSMVRSPQTKRITAEFALVKLCDHRLDASAESLLTRIKNLEDQMALLGAKGSDPSGVVIAKSASPARPAADNARRSENASSVSESLSASTYPETVFRKIRDVSGPLERLSRVNPSIRDFLLDCSFYASPDGKQLKITSGNAFAVMMIGRPENKKSILESFAIEKITDADAVLSIERINSPKADNPFDF